MTNGPALEVRLRPITEADREPLYDLHRAAMRPYVEATWGWDEVVQRDFWTRTAHDDVQVIEQASELVGYLDVQEQNEHIDIVNIVIHPHAHGQGIGTTIMQQIIGDARARGLDVRLQVLKVNPRAKALYERLGFQPYGESATHDLMIRRDAR